MLSIHFEVTPPMTNMTSDTIQTQIQAETKMYFHWEEHRATSHAEVKIPISAILTKFADCLKVKIYLNLFQLPFD